LKLPYLLPLDSPAASLETAGGKGANLARLMEAGFPVPGGFIVTTAAYRAFLQENNLARVIEAALARLVPDNPASLELVSRVIREQFGAGRVPAELAVALSTTYLAQPIAHMAVAVRSSATAEDLPDLSFAGQQDTFLNVVGEEALLGAVIRCWSSLWTARAIGYRARNGISHEGVALAVVIQTMVEAEAAGVLFTANPLTGRRTETVIDAIAGLGEALVSGQVTPDHYVVVPADGQVVTKYLAGEAAVLPDGVIRELAVLGERIAAHFGTPQDIEWAWAEGQLWIVQARPITSLYPLPDGIDPAGELKILASIGAFQGMLDPFTPLGRDTMAAFAARVGRYFGYDRTYATQTALFTAGERLFVDLTPPLRNGTGREIILAALSQVEPGIGQAIAEVLAECDLAPVQSGFSPRFRGQLTRFLLPLLPGAVTALVRPDYSRRMAQQAIERGVAEFGRRSEAGVTLAQRLALLEDTADFLRRYLLGQLLPSFAPGLGCLNILYGLAEQTPAGPTLALEITRGLPHNVTTEMDLALWHASRQIAADPDSRAAFEQPDAVLAGACAAHSLPPLAMTVLDTFLARYGMRGVGEIDLGRPRWREDPAPVIAALRSYLQIDDSDRAPDAVFARGAQEAEAAVDRLAAAVRPLHRGWFKTRLVRWAARRVRALAGQRESPKFTIIRLFGVAREGLLASGADLVAAGVLDRPEDIFYLGLAELHRLAEAEAEGYGKVGAGDLRGVVRERRARVDRERHRRQVPRVLLNDGQAFYEGVRSDELTGSADDASVLTGSAVSPGVVEGRVRVVLNPTAAQLQPGEILVCPGTDPSWTPLFLAAGGLVMEVGGMMTHGSVVAREYGIPAVVGVTRVTHRLKTGQRVRVDGSSGRVTMLPDG
jgi:rifampicin phosphotransferase